LNPETPWDEDSSCSRVFGAGRYAGGHLRWDRLSTQTDHQHPDTGHYWLTITAHWPLWHRWWTLMVSDQQSNKIYGQEIVCSLILHLYYSYIGLTLQFCYRIMYFANRYLFLWRLCCVFTAIWKNCCWILVEYMTKKYTYVWFDFNQDLVLVL